MRSTPQLVTLLTICCSSALSALVPHVTNQEENVVLEDDDSILSPLKPFHVIHECINTTSVDGVFYIKSPGREETCGLYLFSAVNTVIEIELEYVNVPCHTGGLIALVDGWEMNGQLFPGPADHPLPVRERYLEHCGTTTTLQPVRSAQNAALLQYRLPVAGSAISLRVRHLPNPAPCSQLVEGSEIFTLRSVGRRNNCTLLSLNPVEFRVLSYRVGVPPPGIMPEALTGPLLKCDQRAWQDLVEVGEAAGLDATLSLVTTRLCGRSLTPGPIQNTCSGMFVTRLISSGFFNNVVNVKARLLTTEEMITRCFSQYDIPQDLGDALEDYGW
ncbi:corticotropin-releasing factor-binding protein-like [Pollicipes pollicipes]|uniref:corticotropin-releasing factor-binding protein-like n=1 Tax=Pollicipes pollicipes TaxID=41117 RepID=UPI001884AE83|nr:corticotropin-releasing factor-binding protein-like [Pollicipes pollicipes]XP_037080254.1 corticotropin-releasing factor-binding protein-like [Pollicipes pollicipes]